MFETPDYVKKRMLEIEKKREESIKTIEKVSSLYKSKEERTKAFIEQEKEKKRKDDEMKYKAGDIVKIKDGLEHNKKYGGIVFVNNMAGYMQIQHIGIEIIDGTDGFGYSEAMFENKINKYSIGEEISGNGQSGIIEEIVKKSGEEEIKYKLENGGKILESEVIGFSVWDDEEKEEREEIETPTKTKKKRRTKAEMEAARLKEEMEKVSKLAEESGNKDEVFGLEKEYSAVEYAIEKDAPVLLIGETGTGKTHLIRSIAHKQDKELVRLSLNGEVGINEILGKWLVKDGSTYWQDGVLIDCVRNGKWIVVDEINSALPEVLFAMHSLLDDDKAIVLAEKDGEKVEAHKDFRLFASMNPPDEYVGTRELNKALLSRFPMVLYVNQYKPREELKIITYHSGIDSKAGKILIDIASSIRKLKNNREIWYTCSTRDMINAAKLLVGDRHSLEDVLCWSIRNKSSVEEWEKISEAINNAASIEVDMTWKHSDIENLTQDLTKDIEELNQQKLKLQEVVKSFEASFKSVAGAIGV